MNRLIYLLILFQLFWCLPTTAQNNTFSWVKCVSNTSFTYPKEDFPGYVFNVASVSDNAGKFHVFSAYYFDGYSASNLPGPGWKDVVDTNCNIIGTKEEMGYGYPISTMPKIVKLNYRGDVLAHYSFFNEDFASMTRSEATEIRVMKKSGTGHFSYRISVVMNWSGPQYTVDLGEPAFDSSSAMYLYELNTLKGTRGLSKVDSNGTLRWNRMLDAASAIQSVIHCPESNILFMCISSSKDTVTYDSIQMIKRGKQQLLVKLDTSGHVISWKPVVSSVNFIGNSNGIIWCKVGVIVNDTMKFDSVSSIYTGTSGFRMIYGLMDTALNWKFAVSTQNAALNGFGGVYVGNGNKLYLDITRGAASKIVIGSDTLSSDRYFITLLPNKQRVYRSYTVKTPGGTDANYKSGGMWVNGNEEFFIVGIPSGNDLSFCSYQVKDRQLFIAKYGDPASVTPPAVLSSNIKVINKSPGSLTLNWVKGSGAERLVIASEINPVSAFPQSGQVYMANPFFGNGSQIGFGNFVVYKGADTFVTIIGLKPSANYHLAIVEYVGCAPNIVYSLPVMYVDTTPAFHYYTKASGPLNDLLTWGDRPDGSGNSPSSLSIDSVTYHIVNNFTPYIASDSVVFNSASCKVILGDSLSPIELTIPDTTNFVVRQLRVTPYARLRIKGSVTGFGNIIGDSLSEIICINSKKIFSVLNAHDLQLISTRDPLVFSSSVIIRNKLFLDADVQLTSVSIGTDSIHPGELLFASGSIAAPASIRRYIRSATTAAREGFFPLAYYDSGQGLLYKRFFNINFTTAPTRGGLVSVNFVPLMINGKGLPLTDTTGGDSALITRLNKGYWTVSASNLLGGRYEIELNDSNARQDSLKDLRVVQYRGAISMFLAGSYTSNAGTPLYPVVKSSDCKPLVSSPALNYFFTGIDDTSLYKYLHNKPTIQASNFRVANVHNNKILLRWNRGNGYKCMVIARKTSAVNALPVDSFTYAGNASFGSSITHLGSLNYVVYSGDLDSVWVTGLQNNTRYHFAVLEYNGFQGGERYLTSPLPVTTDSTRNYTQYYNKAGMSLSQLSTWGMKPDGSGDTLKSFTMSDVIYNLVNGSVATLTDTLVIAPVYNTYFVGSRFFIGNGTLPFTFTIASTASWLLGTNISLYPKSNSKLVVNGGFSCRSIQQSTPLTAEVEFNTNKMVNAISPVVSKDVWYIPKLKIRGKHYYELPLIYVIDSLELDAMVNGVLAMNNMLSGTTVVNHISGGSTAFGHGFLNGSTHTYPTILIDSNSNGYFSQARPVTVKCSFLGSGCSDPLVINCRKDLGFLQTLTGLPLTDSTAMPVETMNMLYPSHTIWTSRFGWNGSTSCSGGAMLDVYVTDTILPGVLDTHAMALWTYNHSPSTLPIKAEGIRAPYSVSANYITVARTGILQTIGPMFSANSYGLMVDSNKQVLPVNWLVFDAKSQHKDVLLSWSTASEQNNSHFEIERSSDVRNFEFAGKVEGNGTTTNINSYQFIDAGAFAKANSDVLYYRLKQVDFNGDFAYSEIRVVRQNEAELKQSVAAYPNPFHNELFVQLNNADIGCEMRLMDVTGKTWYAQTAKVGVQTIKVNELPAGVYFLQVVSKTATTTIKVTKTY